MIRKSGNRFSEKIMLKQKDNARCGDAALVIKNPSRKTSPIRYMKPDERDVLERQA